MTEVQSRKKGPQEDIVSLVKIHEHKGGTQKTESAKGTKRKEKKQRRREKEKVHSPKKKRRHKTQRMKKKALHYVKGGVIIKTGSETVIQGR